MTSQVGFNPTGGRRESQSKPINLELIIVIHLKDYIKTSTHLDTAIDPNNHTCNNIVSFPDPNIVSKEYIGKFVDLLMQMPEDPHQELEETSYENTDSAMDVVAARILAEEKW